MNDVTLCVPYYRQPLMLRKQIEVWNCYSARVREHLKIIVIDDASPEPASDILNVSDGVQLYRILVDRAWGRNLARNLAANVAESKWLLNIDIDHVLPPESAEALIDTEVSDKYWWRFPRWRVGRADETRRKDSIPNDCEFGRVKEHIDSHLMTRELFLKSPYDSEYVGFLGGGSPFLKRMESIAPVKLLPDSVALHVYTRHAIADASVSTLSRDTSEYAKRKKEKERSGNTVPKNVIDFEWSRVL